VLVYFKKTDWLAGRTAGVTRWMTKCRHVLNLSTIYRFRAAAGSTVAVTESEDGNKANSLPRETPVHGVVRSLELPYRAHDIGRSGTLVRRGRLGGQHAPELDAP
jgi:hypothetical protein